jgi:hypothetical protein
MRTTDFVGGFKIVRQEILTVVWMKIRVGFLGCKCSKGTNVPGKIVPLSSV